MENYLFSWNPENYLFQRNPVPVQIRVRWSIFITISVCAGLPALVWSASYIINHRRNRYCISDFIIPLLLTDCIELFLSPYVLIKLHLNELNWDGDWTCRVSIIVWSLSRVCGLLLNQLVALEGNLSVKYPLYTAQVFSSRSLVTFYVFLFLCIVIACILNHFLVALLVIIVSVVAWIVSCFASCCSDHHSHTSREPDPYIWVVFVFTLLVLYLPLILYTFFLLQFSLSFPLLLHVWFIPCYLKSMRLISDPLLCVLVCRQNLRIQTSQADRTSLV